MKNQKGFTIIELIVVIAIIAVLAAIVLVNVTQYINKGKNTAIEGNLATLVTNAAVFFDTNPTAVAYDAITPTDAFVGDNSLGCGTTSPIRIAITGAGGTLSCFGDPASQAWCGFSNTLAAGSAPAGSFCVDSTGNKVTNNGHCAVGHFTCQ